MAHAKGMMAVMSTKKSRDPISLDEAMLRCTAVSQLARGLKESKDRYEAVKAYLVHHGKLADYIKPGPVDEKGWCILVTHAAAMSKLKQMVPLLENVLKQHGWVNNKVRLKMTSSATGLPNNSSQTPTASTLHQTSSAPAASRPNVYKSSKV